MSIVNNINIKNNANISSKIRCEKVKSKKKRRVLVNYHIQ